MRSMSIRELRDSLSSLQAIVEQEGEVIITRHGRELAKLVPLQPRRGVPSHADLRSSMPFMAAGSEELVRADRERG
jgi:prevent-host-death family protein